MAIDIYSSLQKQLNLPIEQVKIILKEKSFTKPGTIESNLLDHLYFSSEDLMARFAENLGVPFTNTVYIVDFSISLLDKVPIAFAKQHNVLPYKDDARSVTVLVTNPLNLKPLETLRVSYKKQIKPIVIPNALMQDLIGQAFEKSKENFTDIDVLEEDLSLEDTVVDLLDSSDEDAPVIKLVNNLLFRAVKEKASDIHIEPYEKEFVVRFRVDGALYDIIKPPRRLQNAITSRIKVMANLNIAEKRLPQDGRLPLKVGGKDIDIRMSTVPTSFGERIVMRLQDRSNVVLDLNKLGFSQRDLTSLDDLLSRTYGILLVTGPTGSGKSTTLYGALTKINKKDINILTIEDPVEQRISGVGQVQVNSKIGLTFASGLRSFLRQDPDVIMVGEIRDLETADLAIASSMTGHLVLSTLHTNDSAGAIPRLLDLGVEPFLIATSILGILAQRLVRVLCVHCKEEYEMSDFELTTMGITREVASQSKACRAVGCSKCNGTGYLGRTLIEELLSVDDNIRSLILQKKDGNLIKKEAIKAGMVTFREHGIQKVLKGITSVQELNANTQLDI